ncbi:MAG: response regulator [Candidatus Kerfeldbacteria bacterium]|nr:response regulator [Candidatus Kerfeldbacteria bacterium]
MQSPRKALVVDDEEILRDLVTEIAELEGFQVTTCVNGRQALELVQQSPDDISLVITDLEMPSMTGPELIHALREQGSQVPIILMSGNPQKLGQATVELSGCTIRTIGKPFQLAEFRELIIATTA